GRAAPVRGAQRETNRANREYTGRRNWFRLGRADYRSAGRKFLSGHATCAIKANMKSSVHGAIVVVAICSWFAISNHCVFASLATNDTASREGPFHSKTAKQERPSTGAQCCKIFRA